jgi:hypothetical protein
MVITPSDKVALHGLDDSQLALLPSLAISTAYLESALLASGITTPAESRGITVKVLPAHPSVVVSRLFSFTVASDHCPLYVLPEKSAVGVKVIEESQAATAL